MSFDFWIPVKGYENYLMVSASGVIRSIDRFVVREDTGTPVPCKGRELSQQIDKNGYHRVRISVNQTKHTLKVHRVAAEAFWKNPENKPQVNHLNGNKSSNWISNLEWSTNSENQTHAIQEGLKVAKTAREAARFTGSVSAYRDGEFVCKMSGNLEMKENGFDFRLVSAVLCGKRKTHKGCTFVKHET